MKLLVLTLFMACVALAQQVHLEPPNGSVVEITAKGGSAYMEVSGPIMGILVSWQAPIGCWYEVIYPAFPTNAVAIHCFNGWPGNAQGFPFKVLTADGGITAYYTILVK